LWIGAAKKGWGFHRLPQVTFDYRVRPESLLSRVDGAKVVDQLLELIMSKHYDLYQPRLVKQLAKMKRFSIDLGKRINRQSAEITEEREKLTSEAQILTKHLVTGEQAINSLSMQLADKDAELRSITTSRGWRVLNYLRRIKNGFLTRVQ
jgi:hypothetical protein